MIRTAALAKSFGKVQAISSVGFTAPDAAITTLLGANGSGKTTTLRIIAGLIKPDAGEAEIDGTDVIRDPYAGREKLGVFPDRFGLYPRLTAREHLAYFAGLHGVTGKALKTAIDEVTDALRMDDILNRRTEGFSTGQRMKVALARAMIHKPRNLILDEPSRGLDVVSIRLLRDILRRLRDEGCCILFSSHVMAEVDVLSDRILIIAKGEIAADGTAAELRARAGTDDLEDAFVTLAGLEQGHRMSGEPVQ